MQNGGGKLQSDGSVSGREEGAKVFSLAVMCPCLVCGPQLQPTLNTSSEVLMQVGEPLLLFLLPFLSSLFSLID